MLRELYRLIAIIWCLGKVPKRWKYVTIIVFHKPKDMGEYGKYQDISLGSHTSDVLVKVVIRRRGEYCERKEVTPDEQSPVLTDHGICFAPIALPVFHQHSEGYDSVGRICNNKCSLFLVCLLHR